MGLASYGNTRTELKFYNNSKVKRQKSGVRMFLICNCKGIRRRAEAKWHSVVEGIV